jgi:uncharacterized protein YjiS (DUF1127 family)
MTLMTTTTRFHAATVFRRRLSVFLGRLGRLLDGYVASIIAELERRAEIDALRRLSDRQLKDIGLYRGQLEGGLEEAARDRLRQQLTAGS